MQCPTCSGKNEADSNYCDQCGELLLQAPLTLTSPYDTPPRKIKILFIAVLIGACVPLVFWMGQFAGRFVHSHRPIQRLQVHEPTWRGHPDAAAKQEMAVLITQLDSSNKMVQNSALRYFSHIFVNDAYTEEAIRQFSACLRDPIHNSLKRRVIVVRELGLMINPLALGPLIEGLGDSDKEIRWWSYIGLLTQAKTKNPADALPHVITWLQQGLPQGSPVTPGIPEEMLSLFLSSHNLNLDYPFRFSRLGLRQIVKDREHQTVQSKLAIVIISKETLKTQNPITFFSLEPLFFDLRQAGYTVQVYEAARDLDIATVIEQATVNKKASFLLICGHATQRALKFGVENYHPLDLDSIQRLRDRRIWLHFEPGSQALLLGCNSGQGKDQAQNVANDMRQLFPKSIMRRIVAPVDALKVPEHLLFDRVGQFEKYLPGFPPYET